MLKPQNKGHKNKDAALFKIFNSMLNSDPRFRADLCLRDRLVSNKKKAKANECKSSDVFN